MVGSSTAVMLRRGAEERKGERSRGSAKGRGARDGFGCCSDGEWRGVEGSGVEWSR